MNEIVYTEVAGTKKDPTLTFYSLSTCVMCGKARTYLEERGYAYRYVFVDELSDEIKTGLKSELSTRFSMRVTFPCLVIGEEQCILGFFPRAWEKALEDGART